MAKNYVLASSGYMVRWDNDLKHPVLQHREVWMEAHGAIPFGHQIHHKNRVRTDNRLENLECLSQREHGAAHGKEFKARCSWEKKKESGERWTRHCPTCDKQFESLSPRAHYCSATCKRKWFNWINWIHDRVVVELSWTEKACPHCERAFIPTDSHQIYCTPRCLEIKCSRAACARRGNKPTPSRYRAKLSYV